MRYVHWFFSALQHRVSLEGSLKEAAFRGWYGVLLSQDLGVGQAQLLGIHTLSSPPWPGRWSIPDVLCTCEMEVVAKLRGSNLSAIFAVMDWGVIRESPPAIFYSR